MSFEIRDQGLLARIGKLHTRSGTVETPLLFPVINPAVQLISPKRIKEEFGFEALITNAYILKRHFHSQLGKNELRRFLDFDGPVMTDSGAYQILVYGDVDVKPNEIVEYQEHIGSDIATILDVPTGWEVAEEEARRTVNETLKRAKSFFALKSREDILWVGPVQGGKYLDLIVKSARGIGKLAFQIHALGSPTEVMERYRFDVLVDMILTAKMHLPIERPLHLFGAGHPMMFALAVALGCDSFDSAAYSLFAKEGRYLTEAGTCRLNELDYFPCVCPKCARTSPIKVMELPAKEEQVFLAEHNLYACAAELNRIKQAIKDGRMWEHLEMRAHGHPALFQALEKLKKYEHYIEKHDPATKNSGLFFFNPAGLARPEIVRYKRRLAQRYCPPSQAKTLLLLPQTRRKPFHNSRSLTVIMRKLRSPECLKKLHVCFYGSPFSIVPIELDEAYPFSQHEAVPLLGNENSKEMVTDIADYISQAGYEKVLLLNDPEKQGKLVMGACRETCAKRKIRFRSIDAKEKPCAKLVDILEELLNENAHNH